MVMEVRELLWFDGFLLKAIDLSLKLSSSDWKVKPFVDNSIRAQLEGDSILAKSGLVQWYN